MSMKNSKGIIGNGIRDFSAFSSMPQPRAPLSLTIQEASSRDVNTNLQNKVYNYNNISAIHSYLF